MWRAGWRTRGRSSRTVGANEGGGWRGGGGEVNALETAGHESALT